jgi:hypothetical protein
MRTLNGTWHNQHGSQLDLETGPDGRLHGRMTVGDGKARTEAFPLVGFVRGDLVAFTVDFGRHGSLTSWIGHVHDSDGQRPRLETLWHMATRVPHPEDPSQRWKSTWSGADEFTPGCALETRPQMIFWD